MIVRLNVFTQLFCCVIVCHFNFVCFLLHLGIFKLSSPCRKIRSRTLRKEYVVLTTYEI